MPLVTGLMNYIFLDDDRRCRAGHDVAVRGRIRAHGVAGVSTLIGDHAESGRGGRLLHLGLADSRGGNPAIRRQPAGHHREDARARHDHDAHAHLHLDRAVHQRADRGRLPRADRGAGPAVHGPLRWHQLLHGGLRRQRHDVREPDLDLGPP
ncbi:hypothetical protein G6F57_020103 [Rhizopus arrhizus]|nr:hypothetical protein G6F57_020103 [Rhizopus arrhizus]